MDAIKLEQLLKKYRDIEIDISGLLNSYSPGDSSALILDKISHLKHTLTDLMAQYEPGSLEYNSVINQYGQTLRAAMNKGVNVTPEREAVAGVNFDSNNDSDPLSQTEYKAAQQQQFRNAQNQSAATKTNFSLNPMQADARRIDFGMKRAKNGLGGARKIHFNHRPATIFDDVWYGHNEATMDTFLGPKTADEMMIMTHLAMNDEVKQPQNSEAKADISINHSDEDTLNDRLSHITNDQQKRIDTPNSVNLNPPSRF